MNCPYCNKEMEKGVIQSPHEINWQSKKRFFGRADLYGDAVLLAKLDFFKGCAAEAWLCRECKKVIIDYGNEEAL